MAESLWPDRHNVAQIIGEAFGRWPKELISQVPAVVTLRPAGACE